MDFFCCKASVALYSPKPCADWLFKPKGIIPTPTLSVQLWARYIFAKDELFIYLNTGVMSRVPSGICLLFYPQLNIYQK
jgi:hypothetical protein